MSFIILTALSCSLRFGLQNHNYIEEPYKVECMVGMNQLHGFIYCIAHLLFAKFCSKYMICSVRLTETDGLQTQAYLCEQTTLQGLLRMHLKMSQLHGLIQAFLTCLLRIPVTNSQF